MLKPVRRGDYSKAQDKLLSRHRNDPSQKKRLNRIKLQKINTGSKMANQEPLKSNKITLELIY